jgi:hypothetical protein
VPLAYIFVVITGCGDMEVLGMGVLVVMAVGTDDIPKYWYRLYAANANMKKNDIIIFFMYLLLR